MLALAWPWDGGGLNGYQGLAARLGSSLCAGIGGEAGSVQISGLHFAYRRLPSSGQRGRAWRPAILQSGRIVVFHGYFDNAGEIASLLEANADDHPLLYGMAIERWGDEAEMRVVGDYCAVVADPAKNHLRLVRSPFRAPPLYYSHEDSLTAAASVPRALFAAGVPQRLNEAHIADMALVNFWDAEASCFDKVGRVPLGSLVELERGKVRVLRKTYDVLDIPDQPVSSDSDVIRKAGELLDEGVRACLTGFSKPGATLSGGLDTPQVAVRVLSALPPEQKLPTFTFHPEKGWDGRVPRWMMGDERPFAEAFAALHPRLDPHFTSNEGYAEDYRLNELFHLMGSAPPYVCTMYVFHGLLSEASKQQCDVLLLAEYGNRTFSDKGECGFVEYFLKGHWRQLWLALTRPDIHKGPVPQRFIVRTLSAFLPGSAWRLLRRLLFPYRRPLVDLAQPMSADYRVACGANKRQRKSGRYPGRYQPWNRRQSRKLVFGNEDWLADFYQALEQMYGIPLRDPTAYRPFVEYCLGLPTKMFMRDGQLRWLARQMAKGIMPEEQRLTSLEGWWDADWHIRIGRRRHEFLAEIDRLEKDERIGPMMDIPRLRAALENWPEQTEIDYQKFFGPQLAVPAALVISRFINYVEGRNTP